MLGNVGLPPAERGFEVTDAGFACADGEQDGNALRRGNGGQRRGDLFGDLGQDLFFHIHKPECIIHRIQKTNMKSVIFCSVEHHCLCRGFPDKSQ